MEKKKENESGKSEKGENGSKDFRCVTPVQGQREKERERERGRAKREAKRVDYLVK